MADALRLRHRYESGTKVPQKYVYKTVTSSEVCSLRKWNNPKWHNILEYTILRTDGFFIWLEIYAKLTSKFLPRVDDES